MFKRITNGQVKQIAQIVNERFELVNYGSHYKVIDRKTNKTSHDSRSLVSYNMDCLIEREYLKMADGDALYLDWSVSGVKESNARKNYIYLIKYKVAEILCGYKYENFEDMRKSLAEKA